MLCSASSSYGRTIALFNNTSPEPEESRILTPRDHYNLIKRGLSFSFQKKKSGPRQWIKIIVLTAAIILLSWYGRQSFNNPFRPFRRLVISGPPASLSILVCRRDTVLIILPFEIDSLRFAGTADPLPEHWDLVSRTSKIAESRFSHPPDRWRVVDTVVQPFNRLPSGWPSCRSYYGNEFENCTISSIRPFNDARNLLKIVVSGITILLIDGADFSCSGHDTTQLREKSDLLIIRNVDTSSAITFRSVFRPHYTVAFGASGDRTPQFPNLLYCASPASEELTFLPASHNRIVFNNRRKIALPSRR